MRKGAELVAIVGGITMTALVVIPPLVLMVAISAQVGPYVWRSIF